MCARTGAIDRLRRFLREESGPTAVEYAVMLGLIVLVAASMIRAVGESVYGIWQTIDGAVKST
jgi:pilus assembly protein Flp/PilA